MTQACSNAEPGTFNHECGKPAEWLADCPSKFKPGETFTAAFCSDCKEHGYEARAYTDWRAI